MYSGTFAGIHMEIPLGFSTDSSGRSSRESQQFCQVFLQALLWIFSDHLSGIFPDFRKNYSRINSLAFSRVFFKNFFFNTGSGFSNSYKQYFKDSIRFQFDFFNSFLLNSMKIPFKNWIRFYPDKFSSSFSGKKEIPSEICRRIVQESLQKFI